MLPLEFQPSLERLEFEFEELFDEELLDEFEDELLEEFELELLDEFELELLDELDELLPATMMEPSASLTVELDRRSISYPGA